MPHNAAPNGDATKTTIAATVAKNTVSAVSMVGAILGGTLCGYFSDRYGRRRAMVWALRFIVWVERSV